MPWDGATNPAHHEHLVHAIFAAGMELYSYVNLNYFFCSCANLTSVAGLGNLGGMRSMRFAFASAGVTELDFRGFDSSTLTDLTYCFLGYLSLATIYADADWALPASGIADSQCFYNCKALIGGNGTTWTSSRTAYTYTKLDLAGSPGYLTVA